MALTGKERKKTSDEIFPKEICWRVNLLLR